MQFGILKPNRYDNYWMHILIFYLLLFIIIIIKMRKSLRIKQINVIMLQFAIAWGQN